MEITLLTNNSIRARVLASLLIKEGINLTRVITVGKKDFKPAPLIMQVKKILAPVKQFFVLDKKTRLALRKERISMIRANELLKSYFEKIDYDTKYPQVKYIKVTNVNSTVVIDEFESNPPDICVVYGTDIIKDNILKLAKICFLNAHSSVLPMYRGAKSEFWQCYNNDYNNVGITIHAVDAGVDSGSIYFQKEMNDISFPEPHFLRAKNTISILKNYPHVVKAVIEDRIKPIAQKVDKGNRPYKFSDITYKEKVELYSNIELQPIKKLYNLFTIDN